MVSCCCTPLFARRANQSATRRLGQRHRHEARVGLDALEDRVVLSPLVYSAKGAGLHVIVLKDVGAEIEIFDNHVLKAHRAKAATSSVKINGADVSSTISPGSTNIFDIDQTAVPTTINFGSTQDRAFVSTGAAASELAAANANVRGIKEHSTFMGSTARAL